MNYDSSFESNVPQEIRTNSVRFVCRDHQLFARFENLRVELMNARKQDSANEPDEDMDPAIDFLLPFLLALEDAFKCGEKAAAFERWLVDQDEIRKSRKTGKTGTNSRKREASTSASASAL